MKKLLVLLLLAIAAPALRADISDISLNGSWYRIYDENGKLVRSLSVSSTGEIVGWSSKFFISRSGSWYRFYNAQGKHYRSASVSSIGQIVSVSGDRFVSRSGSWLRTYSSDGKLISSRSAR